MEIINAAKMKVRTSTSKTMAVFVDGGKMEQVYSFGYLGSRITDGAYCKGGVKACLRAWHQCFDKKAEKNKTIRPKK